MSRLRLIAAVTFSAISVAAIHAVPSVYPTGTTIYDPAKTWSGYTVFVLPQTGAVLIDMNGKAVREWTTFEGASGGPMRTQAQPRRTFRFSGQPFDLLQPACSWTSAAGPKFRNSRRLSPDVPGRLDDKRQLLLLVVHGDRIAHEVAGKAALRAQAQLIERQVFRGLVDPPLDDVL